MVADQYKGRRPRQDKDIVYQHRNKETIFEKRTEYHALVCNQTYEKFA
jgi:hypothetical protein